MSGDAVARAIHEHSAAIVTGVQQRMREDPDVVAMASARSTDAPGFSSRVVGFWLQGIETDLSLGSTAATEQSLAWLARLRAGQDVHFDDQMVTDVFEDISSEVLARLSDSSLVAEYVDYRDRVRAIICEVFPGQATDS